MHDIMDDVMPQSQTQHVLLWCLRMWVLQLKNGVAAEDRIAMLLDGIGAEAAIVPMRVMMETLSTQSTRMIDIQCVCRTDVNADERALLDVLALAQSFDHEEGYGILCRFMTAGGAARVLRCAGRIGTALLTSGTSLSYA